MENVVQSKESECRRVSDLGVVCWESSPHFLFSKNENLDFRPRKSDAIYLRCQL